MIINRRSDQIGGLLPEAVVTLSSTFAVPLHHLAHSYKTRHPLGTYNISLQSILAGFNLVLQELDKLAESLPLKEPARYDGSPLLMEAQKNLLRSLDEHFDDCKQILRAFFAPGDNFKGNSHVIGFNQAVEPYSKHVRDIVNHLKHSQGRLRPTIIITDQVIVPTYYVEGIDKSGIPGPDPKIHPPSNPVFSFSRDLRYHFCKLYIVSNYLAEAITNIVSSPNITLPSSVNGKDSQIAEIAKAISEFPKTFLKHERGMDVPSVEVSDLANVTQLSIALPGTGKSLPPINLGDKTYVLTSMLGDGTTATFRLPFAPKTP